ncbi:MAG: S-methyl-5'-thioadenosine phosphorylase [Nitrospinota bacterium]|nr:S-methyl-5'-thioadenosine phosphorylase [Nitrospinota bacterium]
MPDMRIGIIGGSGLYEMEGLSDIKKEEIKTPFGSPSDKYITGKLNGADMVFLPRHGIGHRLLPGEINYRANIYGMKVLGVTHIISVSAVGSMKENIAPGHIVIPNQFIDLTKNRISTFTGNGFVAHVSLADPICPQLSSNLYEAGLAVGATMHKGGTYLCMEGPQFSSRAESHLYRDWGIDIIGMTNATEAKLAREAEICYATVALSTDYDCWHVSEEDVTADAIIKIIQKNTSTAKELIRKVVSNITPKRDCGCSSAMQNAIVTNPSVIPEETKKALKPIIDKYIQ